MGYPLVPRRSYYMPNDEVPLGTSNFVRFTNNATNILSGAWKSPPLSYEEDRVPAHGPPSASFLAGRWRTLPRKFCCDQMVRQFEMDRVGLSDRIRWSRAMSPEI
jgi:hypothetical protein